MAQCVEPAAASSSSMSQLAMAGVLGAGIFFAAWWPLGTYAVTLAVCGVPHVVSELRYVDGRFSPRLPRRLWSTLVVLGALVMASRVVSAAELLPRGWQPTTELSLLVLLGGAVVPMLLRNACGLGLVSAIVVVSIAAAAWTFPVLTLTIFALVHNVTPLGFLVEAAAPAERWRTAMVAACVYVGIPVLFVIGVGDLMIDAMGLRVRDDAPFVSAGTLAQHLSAYVPRGITGDDARRLFTGAVVAQVFHYHATIVVMPRLSRRAGDAAPRMRWPSLSSPMVMVPALLVTLFFFVSFTDARALYGVAAAFHAWIELPLLLLCLPSRASTRGTSR